MQHFLNQSQESLADTHHDLLSVRPGDTNHSGLLSHLQTGPANPLDLLFQEEIPAESLLQNVQIEPEAPAEPVAEEIPPRVVQLGPPVPLSKSLLWQMQLDYYSSMGVSAWEHNVPCFITNSTYIAENYAEMIMAFLKDYHPHLNTDEPVYIVEMASGTGRFSSHLLRELQTKLAFWSNLKDLKIRYIMTDFTENNIQFWESHKVMKPFIESGMLDFAIFHPETHDSLTLRVSGDTVSGDTVKNPMIVMANYFFDSIRQDVFRVENHRLNESRVVLHRTLAHDQDENSNPHITEIQTEFRNVEMRSDNHYAEPKWNAILKQYKQEFERGSFLMPVGAFDVIRNLQTMSNNKVVLISSDKAYTRANLMMAFDTHQFAIHDGAFSYMVNYDAIGRYFLNEGGSYLHTNMRNLSLQTVCCISMDAPDCTWDHLNYHYREKLDRTNTINSQVDLQTLLMEPEASTISKWIDTYISLLRLDLCEPKTVTMVGPKLVDLMPNISWGQQDDLIEVLEACWERYYFYRGECNLPFWMGQLYFAMGKYERAMFFFEETSCLFGKHQALYFFKAKCLESLGQWAESKENYIAALTIEPNFPEAIEGLQSVEAKLASQL